MGFYVKMRRRNFHMWFLTCSCIKDHVSFFFYNATPLLKPRNFLFHLKERPKKFMRFQEKSNLYLDVFHTFLRNRGSKSVVLKIGQKMALRVPYLAICPQVLWTHKSAIFWSLLKTIDLQALWFHRCIEGSNLHTTITQHI